MAINRIRDYAFEEILQLEESAPLVGFGVNPFPGTGGFPAAIAQDLIYRLAYEQSRGTRTLDYPEAVVPPEWN